MLRKAGAGKVFREVASGTRSNRAQLRRALNALDRGTSQLVTRLDRLARSTCDLRNTLTLIFREEGWVSVSQQCVGEHRSARRTSPPHLYPLLAPQETVNSAGRYRLQLLGYQIASAQFAQLAQPIELLSQHQCQALSARLFENVPDLNSAVPTAVPCSAFRFRQRCFTNFGCGSRFSIRTRYFQL
jgi:Resolvase, N terminal domain